MEVKKQVGVENEEREAEWFCQRLRECRLKLEMTQEQLAEAANLHRTYISELEKGRKSPSLHTLGRLARALQMEVWQLLLGQWTGEQKEIVSGSRSLGEKTDGERELKRVKLIVAYDGTAYCGWQIQKNGITVEEVLNEHLSRLLGEDIQVIGASRTDAGVHALGNVAVFDTQSRIPGEKISYALNQRLPEDVRIQGSEEVELDFHPRYRNSRKTYEYRIYNGPFEMPVYRNNTYFFHRRLDVEKMQQAVKYFLGEHDFAAFCSAHAQVKETTRTIYDLQVSAEEENSGQLIRIRISGNGFLYNMVRIVTGTLIEVGLSKYPPQRVKEIIDGCDRNAAGPCAPAKGLTLIGIEYEKTLADELVVMNERMYYSLMQKAIAEKQEAYLTVYWCQDELLEDLIVRMTKKAFRLGAKKIYVRNKENPVLSRVLAPSKRNTYAGGEFFTAGDFRYVLDHEIWQMDRDLRAYPAKVEQAVVTGNVVFSRDMAEVIQEGEGVQICPLAKENVETFCKLYKNCFYSQPCGAMLTEKEALAMIKSQESVLEHEDASHKEEKEKNVVGGEEQGYIAYSKEKPVGILVTAKSVSDEDALYVWAIGVESCSRRKGYGQALLEWTAAKASEEGYKRITLEVSSKNKKAISLYEKNGFYRIKSGERCWYRADNRKNLPKMGKTDKK